MLHFIFFQPMIDIFLIFAFKIHKALDEENKFP